MTNAGQWTHARWKTSSRSQSGAQCVEAASDGAVAVRDSKNRGAGMLVFPARSWAGFTAHLKR
ncbi:DUF397 domain-containing protein [Actinosynnema sp. NPDC020468]|uniref:DUF397 domain-containing protein n=1 Tax=Actinosynnema sp. NPDC020468 TaxID=3154488 RepID=UPI0033CD243F